MPNRDSQTTHYPTVELVLDSIADWVNRYRNGTGSHKDFGQCDGAEVMRIADDLGVSSSELRDIASKGPGGADLLRRMLDALHVDPNEIINANPGVMRDLQRLCANCADKKRCAHELDDGTAAEHFHEFCPNAFTLDALFKDKLQPAKQ